MLTKLRTHLTYANVMATIAVFAAVGGTSYAAVRITSGDIANNTIKSRDIKNSSILSQDIKNNSVRSRDVRDGSLLLRDFRPGQFPAGPAGPKGDKGEKGEKGDKGNDGASTGTGGGTGGSASVVARARTAAPFTPTADSPVPLTGNTWTQDAAEADTIVARVTSGGTSSCSVSVIFSLDGVRLSDPQDKRSLSTPGETLLIPLAGFPSGSSAARTLNADAFVDDMDCGDVSTNTLSVDIAVDVIGAR